MSGGRPRVPLEQRFWLRVPQTPNARGCLEWIGARDRVGYGFIGSGGGKWGNYGGRQLRAHRVSWELQRGPIPPGMFVCHRCDNPSCVNIEHLFLGTAKDNTADMLKKGRGRIGWRASRVALSRALEAAKVASSSTKGDKLGP